MANPYYGPPSWLIDEDHNKKSPGDPVVKTPPNLGSNPLNIATEGGQAVTWPSAIASELFFPSMVDSYLSGPVLNDPNNMGWWSKLGHDVLSDPGKAASDFLINKAAGGLLGVPGYVVGAGRKFWDILTDTQDPAPVEEVILDPSQQKGLEGRTLSPYKKIKPKASKSFKFGEEFKSKKQKKESVYQREQRKRKEEEEDAFQRMLMQYNQGIQNAISRPSIVPPVIWDAYVPDEGMSNYAVFDDIGKFEGIDMDAMLESMGIGPPPGYSKRKV